MRILPLLSWVLGDWTCLVLPEKWVPIAKGVISALLITALLSMTACTTTHSADGSWESTVGKAKVVHCDQMVFPEGTNDPNSEAIGFGCDVHESYGVSGEFASILSAIINVIPGLPALTSWLNKI